jgi:hypothetical protein
MLLLRATASGSQTTLVDAINVADPNATLVGRVGIVSGGTEANLGTVVRVTNNVESTNTVTFTPALPSSTVATDEIELWNEMDQGVTPAELNRMIDLAVEAAADIYPVPATSDAQDFSQSSPVLDIDTEWRRFSGVDRQDVSDRWHPIPKRYLRVDVEARTVEILYPQSQTAHNNSVRIRGATRMDLPTADDDDLKINGEWLVNYVAYLVMKSAAKATSMYGESYERDAADFQAKADALRLSARSRVEGMGVILL